MCACVCSCSVFVSTALIASYLQVLMCPKHIGTTLMISGLSVLCVHTNVHVHVHACASAMGYTCTCIVSQMCNSDTVSYSPPLQPAGHAVAMVLVPAMHSGDSRVFLWGRSNVASPLHIFTGHSEAVLEVQWRCYRGGEWVWSYDSHQCNGEVALHVHVHVLV